MENPTMFRFFHFKKTSQTKHNSVLDILITNELKIPATSYFLIPLSLQLVVINLRYFTL